MDPQAVPPNDSILKITKAEQYKTVGELFERSQPNSVYYTLLVLSVIIVSCGLLLQNAPIVIGGMLVTPVLTPLLTIALGITVGEIKSLKDPSLLVLKSIIITIVISALLTFLFGVEELDSILLNDLRSAVLYFLIAATSGIAATFAWVRKQVADILPGISIAVSLVPPLSLIGIQLALFNLEATRFYALIFIFNLVGILLGALIVFSLLKFQKSGWAVKQQVEEAKKIQEYKEAEKTAEKVEEKLEQIKINLQKTEELEKERKI